MQPCGEGTRLPADSLSTQRGREKRRSGLIDCSCVVGEAQELAPYFKWCYVGQRQKAFNARIEKVVSDTVQAGILYIRVIIILFYFSIYCTLMSPGSQLLCLLYIWGSSGIN